jgi:hypothetical protein
VLTSVASKKGARCARRYAGHCRGSQGIVVAAAWRTADPVFPSSNVERLSTDAFQRLVARYVATASQSCRRCLPKSLAQSRINRNHPDLSACRPSWRTFDYADKLSHENQGSFASDDAPQRRAGCRIMPRLHRKNAVYNRNLHGPSVDAGSINRGTGPAFLADDVAHALLRAAPVLLPAPSSEARLEPPQRLPRAVGKPGHLPSDAWPAPVLASPTFSHPPKPWTPPDSSAVVRAPS